MNVFLDPFRAIFKSKIVENGLAWAVDDLNPIIGSLFKSLYEKVNGLIDSSQLSGMAGDNDIQYPFLRTPGRYTGEMRKVVQALLSNGNPVVYDYKFNTSHGVATASDGSKWLIEISTSGVQAMPLPVKDPMMAGHEWLGYTPKYQKEIFTPADNPIILLTALEMDVFYSKLSIFSACGWAFNSDGAIASNTCYDNVSGDLTAYTFDIEITFTNDVPSSATITQSNSGRFKFATNQGFKCPNGQEEYIASFTSNSGSDVDGDVTLYVFYDDLEKIEMKGFSRTSKTENYNDTVPDRWTDCTLPFPGYVSQYNQTYKTAGSATVSGNGCYINNKFYETEYANGAEMEEYICTPYLKSNYVAINGTNWYNYNYKLTTERNFKQDFAKKNTSFCIIPIGDREAIYQFERKEQTSVVWDYELGVTNARSTYDNCDSKAKQVGEQDCREGYGYIVYGTDSLTRQTSFIEHSPVGNGTIICDFPSAPTDFSCSSEDKSGNTELSAELYLVASGGINQLILSDPSITELNRFNVESFEQKMLVYSDCSAQGYFCSDDIDGISGSEYYISPEVDQIKYPANTLPSGINRFWIGNP